MTAVKHALSAVGLTVLAVTLAGCGSFFEREASYDSMSELRQAVHDAGVPCAADTASDPDPDGEMTLRCDNDLVLNWFSSEKEQAKGVIDFVLGLEGDHVILTGQNWIVQGDIKELTDLQKTVGGQLLEED